MTFVGGSPSGGDPNTPANTRHRSADVKYPKFLGPDILSHLLRPSGVPDWPRVVELYLDYEVASPSKSVSECLPVICSVPDQS